VADSNDSHSPRSGPFLRPLLTPPSTPSDRNGLELSHRSEQPLLSNIRSPFRSSGSSGIGSYRGRGIRASIDAVSAATSQAVSVPRPLPHSPPPYSSNRASLQPSPSSQNNSSAPSPLSAVFPSDEKRRSHHASDGTSRVGQPQPFDGENPIRSTAPSTDDNPGAQGPQSPFRDPTRAASSSALAGPFRDSTMSSSTEMEHANVPPSSWRSALSPSLLRPTSVVSDPFNNRGFELPSWLDADPYSRSEQEARATTSVYSVAQRSVAASSKILPSDTSLRTLTPEPSEDNHDATLHVAVLARLRTTSLGQGTDIEGALPGESVEGDGPESHAVQISGGAQRKGWGTENKQQQQQPLRREAQRASSSGRPRLLHLRHRSSEIVHPALAPSSPSTGVPLSAEFEARGLGRSFIQSLIGKVRWSNMTHNDNPRPLATPQEATRSPEDLPVWLHGDPFEMSRASVGAASSKLLPSEIGHGDACSIRSISAEVGWVEPRPESGNMQSPSKSISESVDEHGAVDVPQRVVNQKRRSTVAPDAQESSQSQSQSPALSPMPVPPPP
jgi:hypothetical protein